MPQPRSPFHRYTDADAALLPTYVRFNDLVAANVVHSWSQLAHLVRDEGFPAGVLISRNTRAWELTAVREWLASRPTGRLPVERQLRERDKRAAAEVAS